MGLHPPPGGGGASASRALSRPRPTEAPMPTNRTPPINQRALWAALILTLAAALIQAPAWGAPVAAPDRQTVPLTPPATWTPRPAPPTATRTVPLPPTTLPTLPPPTAMPPTSAPPTAALPPTDTPPPTFAPTHTLVHPTPTAATPTPSSAPSPTREGAIPRAWLALTGAPDLLAPGVPITLTLQVASVGNVPLENALLTLDGLAALVDPLPAPDAGRVTLLADRLTWALPALPPGESLTLLLTAHAPQDLLPSATLPLLAELAWDGPPLQVELLLAAPWALLPDTGL
ncbi:MAG: hypothetical protein ACYC5M_03280 [Anaerolineae bacterium]